MGSVKMTGCFAIAALVCLSMVVDGVAQRGIPRDFNAWTPKQTRYSPDGRRVELILNDSRASYTGMGSKQSWLFGGIGAWIKLPANDSAGTVTTFYMASTGPKHCEFDFEFLGNSTGQPYLLHTNIFVDGIGGREQQIRLWYDPTAAFHYYNFQWNKDLLVFYIDNTAIRMFRNLEDVVPGFMYPNKCPMGIYLSIWDGSSWATCGGRVKLNWKSAPFIATYELFRLRGCVATMGDQASITKCQNTTYAAPGKSFQTIGTARKRQLRKIRANYIHYNYCDDTKRYNETQVPECKYNVL